MVIPSGARSAESRDLHLQGSLAFRTLWRLSDSPSPRARRDLRPVRTFYVYILASRSRTLYVGVTNDIARRLAQHRLAQSGYSARYRCVRLVFVEAGSNAKAAIAREKQIKNWRREKKIALIQAANPAWDDLSADPSTRCARSG